MSNPSAVAHLSIGGVTIKQDADGRFCLNDLHKAAGGEDRHAPDRFLRLDSTVELVDALSNSPEMENKNPVATKAGRYGGTFTAKEIAIAYANWISAPFYLKVIRTFDAFVTGRLDTLPMLANLDQLLESVITSPAVMTRLGAMFKAVFIKQANDAINERLPALVEAAQARSIVNVVPGISAGEVWHDMLHLPTLRNGPQYLSRVLRKLGCRIEGEGCAKARRGSVIMFDRDKVKNQIKHSGLEKFMREYVAGRLGQVALFPISASMLYKAKPGSR